MTGTEVICLNSRSCYKKSTCPSPSFPPSLRTVKGKGKLTSPMYGKVLLLRDNRVTRAKEPESWCVFLEQSLTHPGPPV